MKEEAIFQINILSNLELAEKKRDKSIKNKKKKLLVKKEFQKNRFLKRSQYSLKNLIQHMFLNKVKIINQTRIYKFSRKIIFGKKVEKFIIKKA